MSHIIARNVNEALATALTLLQTEGEMRPSRNGPVIAFPNPVETLYTHPTERVLFSKLRNANPTFHLLESLWMLAGRNDVKFPATLVKNMANFSDDGKTFWGAYGHRWRNFFGWDQIDAAIDELKANPESRRVVVSMWNAMDYSRELHGDIAPDFIVAQNGGLDVPCNTHIYLDTRDGKLNMTVCCRSNDILWGAYGANAVHMSVFQEYIALSIGVPVGRYSQFSNNLHLYVDKFPKGISAQDMAISATAENEYLRGMVPMPLIEQGETREDFDEDLELFFDVADGLGLGTMNVQQFSTTFFNHTIVPISMAWHHRKKPEFAHRLADKIAAPDWAWAMRQWIEVNFEKGVK